MHDFDEIELGDTYQDSITGFTGVATGKGEYLTGCAQVLLESTLTTSEPCQKWFDFDRLTHVDRERVELKRTTAGGPEPSAQPARPAPR